MLPVPKSYLEPLEFIGDGRRGSVYRTHYRTSGSDPTDLVYKEYKESPVPGVRGRSAARAERAVKFRDDLAHSDSSALAVLDTYFAWPRGVVEDDVTKETLGLLMPLTPLEYRCRLLPQGYFVTAPRTLDWIVASERMRQMNMIDLPEVSQTDRLLLMAQLAYAIAWLHKQGRVFGDLNLTNVAFAMDPPRLLIFGCDEAASLSDPDRGLQQHAPFWVPPECQGDELREQDPATDVYKLGLAIIRCLKSESGAVATFNVGRLTGILDAEGMQLLTRTLSVNRNERPTAKELFTYLSQFSTPRIAPPTIAHAELITPRLLRGSDARIAWQITGAEVIRVLLGENPQAEMRTVSLGDHPAGCAFPVTQSGRVTVIAENSYGATNYVIGYVAVVDIPQIGIDLSKLPASFDSSLEERALEQGRQAGHAFISYVRGDTRQVDQLQRALRAARIPVWRDTDNLWPGEDWRMKIRRAISQNALVFIACFSQASLARAKSYQNEELTLAIEQLRLRPQDDVWLIPVRFDECEVPDLDIGGGRTLRWLQSADLFGERAGKDTERLIATVLQILRRKDNNLAAVDAREKDESLRVLANDAVARVMREFVLAEIDKWAEGVRAAIASSRDAVNTQEFSSRVDLAPGYLLPDARSILWLSSDSRDRSIA